MPGQVVAVASGKGGVGKTTTVVNLGVVLRRADHSVALVDADLGMANLGPMLGVDAELTLHDVLSGEASIDEALVEEAPGFAVLAGSEALADYPAADPGHLREVLDTLAASYDFVIVDTGAGMSHEDVLPLGLADRVVLVASPDPAAIGDTRKTAELAGLAAGDIAGLVVTKADPQTDAEEVAAEVGVDLLGVIPYDPTVRQSTAAGRPLEAVDPDTDAAVAYRDLAGTLSDGAADPLREAPAAEEMHADAAPASEVEPGGEEPTPDAAVADAEASASTSDSPADEPEEDGAEPTDEPEAQDETAPPADEAAEPSADDARDAEPGETETTEDEVPAESEASGDGQEAQATEEPESEADEVADHETDEAEDESVEATDEAETDEPEPSDDEPDSAEAKSEDEPESAEAEPEEEEDPLAEFIDDEPEASGGLLSRIGRLFR